MSFRPLHDQVLIRRLANDGKTKGQDLLIARESDIHGLIGQGPAMATGDCFASLATTACLWGGR